MMNSETSKMNGNEGDVKNEADVESPTISSRKRLLAQVAGNIASGVVMAPSPKATTAEKIAQISVELAEAILQKVGL